MYVYAKCAKMLRILSISFAQTIAPYILQKYTFVFKIKNKFDFLMSKSTLSCRKILTSGLRPSSE